MKMIRTATAALAVALGLATAATAEPWSPPADKPQVPAGVAEPLDLKKPLTIYHIEGRRSQRIAWLAEELGIPYNLVYVRGDVPGSGGIIRALPIRISFAPTIWENGRYMFESGALVEYLLAKYGKGRLLPAKTSPDYPIYLNWLHFAEGAGMSRFYRDQTGLDAEGFSRFNMGQKEGKPKTDVSESMENLDAMEAHLSKYPYFGGSQFSGADIMMYWAWERGVAINEITGNPKSKYPKVYDWGARMEARPAYKRTMLRALPDNQPDQCRVQCKPGSSRPAGTPPAPR